MEKHHPDEYHHIISEIHHLRIRAYRGELPLKVRLSRTILIPAVKAKLASIVHHALHALRRYWPLHTSL